MRRNTDFAARIGAAGSAFWIPALVLCLLTGCASKPDKAAVDLTNPQTPPHALTKSAMTDRNANAILALEQTVQSKKASASSYNQLGMLYRESGRFADARGAYESALRINPDYALAHRNLGILLDIYLQQPQQALVHYRAYAQLSGNQNTEAALWVAELQQRLGVKPEASEAKP